jgi:hypothetical protein
VTTNRFTYRQFDQLLLSLGFTRQHVAPKWRRYDHPASDTMIAVVEKGPDELVRSTDAVAARLLLAEKGLISEKEFIRRLERSAGQPTASGEKDG